MEIFGDTPCVPGLFVAGIFSGALSTVRAHYLYLITL